MARRTLEENLDFILAEIDVMEAKGNFEMEDMHYLADLYTIRAGVIDRIQANRQAVESNELARYIISESRSKAEKRSNKTKAKARREAAKRKGK